MPKSDGFFHATVLPPSGAAGCVSSALGAPQWRFVDALRAGLQLKDQFPQHDIKVSVSQTRSSTEEIMQRTALH
jgi:hypothetical protein